MTSQILKNQNYNAFTKGAIVMLQSQSWYTCVPLSLKGLIGLGKNRTDKGFVQVSE